ncbi:MAG TPA: SufS family cysteine desulfurase [Myxococcota bacterium]|nr:SufS family cysteine desulfurase [Myxococcota bacterium]
MDFKADFPIFQSEKPFIYLDTAATAHKPRQVIEALSHFYAKEYATVHRGVYSQVRAATEVYHHSRIKVQRFINAAYPEEIIFTRGTTASLNFLARAFAEAFLKKGDAILLTEVEHHSNLVPWQMVAKQKELELRFIKIEDAGELDWCSFETLLLDGKVKLVSLAHMSNVLGTIHPASKIIEAAHAKGALVCLDGAQAAAHLPIDVQALDADFYTFSGHKLYGPTGVGILYGKKELLLQLPPFEGGGDMVEKVTLQQATYNSLPYKFEAGTPMIAEVIGLGSALDYLNTIGMENIQRWERELLTRATQRLLEIEGVRIIGSAKEKGAILSFTIEGVHPLDLATLLDCQGVAIRSGHHCSQPTMDRFQISACSRLSFGLYNNFQDIEHFIEILKILLNLF